MPCLDVRQQSVEYRPLQTQRAYLQVALQQEQQGLRAFCNEEPLPLCGMCVLI